MINCRPDRVERNQQMGELGGRRAPADLVAGLFDGVRMTVPLPPEVATLGLAVGLMFALVCCLVANLPPGGMISPGGWPSPSCRTGGSSWP